MEKSGFFNAMKKGDTWDRVYKAENFAEYFATFIGNGIFPNPASNLQVKETDKMQIIIKAGKAWINGFIYINTEDLVLDIDVADGVLHRIDKVVLRYDVVNREIRAYVKKGEYRSNPIAPEVQRNADMYELALADIKIDAGAIRISQAYITDLRLNKSMCGIVHGTVDQVDTTAIFNQFQDWYSQKKKQYNENMLIWTTDKKQAFEEWYENNTSTFMNQFNTWYTTNITQWDNDFNTWFKTVKGILDKSVEGNLLKLINENKNEISNLDQQLKDTQENVNQQMIDLQEENVIKYEENKTELKQQLDIMKTTITGDVNNKVKLAEELAMLNIVGFFNHNVKSEVDK